MRSIIIDYVIVNQESSIKIKDVRVKRGAECGTDHKLVIARMQFPFIWTQQKPTLGDTDESTTPAIPVNVCSIKEKKFNINLLEEDSIKDLYKRRFNQKLEEFRYESLEQTYEHIKTCIKTAALETLGEKDQKYTHQNTKLNEDTLKCIQEKKELHIKYLNTKNYEDLELYREKNKEVKRKVAKEKNERWEKTCTENRTTHRRNEKFRVMAYLKVTPKK